MVEEQIIATNKDLKRSSHSSNIKSRNKHAYKPLAKPLQSSVKTFSKQQGSLMKTQNETEQQLEDLAASEKILLTVTTVFPFKLFPDTIIITKEKITIKHKNFFYSESIKSILIKDVVNVESQTSIMFGKLEIVDRYFAQIPLVVSFLWRNDALKAREMIQGLITSERNNIDIVNASTEVLKKQLPEIGKTSD